MTSIRLLTAALLTGVIMISPAFAGPDAPADTRAMSPAWGPRMQERLDKMTPEERQAFEEHRKKMLERYQNMTPEQKKAFMQRREAMRRKWQNMSPEEKEKFRQRREAMRQKWQNMSPEEKEKFRQRREAMRQKWQSMTPEQRQQLHDRLKNATPEERKKIWQEFLSGDMRNFDNRRFAAVQLTG